MALLPVVLALWLLGAVNMALLIGRYNEVLDRADRAEGWEKWALAAVWPFVTIAQLYYMARYAPPDRD